MANPTIFAFPVGTDYSRVLQVTSDGATPVAGVYLSSDTLSARLWVGGDQPSLFSPTGAWVDAPNSKFSVGFAAAQTAALAPGTYFLQVLATRGGQSVALVDGAGVELRPGPGSAAALKSYCTFADMLEIAPWVAKLSGAGDYAGFARERDHAALWFEDLVHRHYRGGNSIGQDYFFVPGISFSGAQLNRYATIYRPGTRSTVVQGWLDTGGVGGGPGLLQTRQTAECNACYAVAQAAGNQVSSGGGDKSDWYARKRCEFVGRAEALASLITVELSIDGTGNSSIYVRLGVHDTLDG